MKKTEKKQKKSTAKHTQGRPIVNASGAIDWTLLRSATKDALRWARDLAMAESCDAIDDERIDGVFTALEGIVDSAPYERVPLADILLVLRTVGALIEHDRGITPGTFDLAASVLSVAFGPTEEPRPVPAPMPTIYHLAPHAAPRVMRAPSAPLAEVCALANRIAALVGPSGPLAVDLHR